MPEGVDFTVSYGILAGTRSLCIIIVIASLEGLINFFLDICDAFHNTIISNPVETLYLS